jgi:hypothetical protein
MGFILVFLVDKARGIEYFGLYLLHLIERIKRTQILMGYKNAQNHPSKSTAYQISAI